MASDGYSLGKAHWGGGRQGGSSEEAASGKSFLRGKPDPGLEGYVRQELSEREARPGS